MNQSKRSFRNSATSRMDSSSLDPLRVLAKNLGPNIVTGSHCWSTAGRGRRTSQWESNRPRSHSDAFKDPRTKVTAENNEMNGWKEEQSAVGRESVRQTVRKEGEALHLRWLNHSSKQTPRQERWNSAATRGTPTHQTPEMSVASGQGRSPGGTACLRSYAVSSLSSPSLVSPRALSSSSSVSLSLLSLSRSRSLSL